MSYGIPSTSPTLSPALLTPRGGAREPGATIYSPLGLHCQRGPVSVAALLGALESVSFVANIGSLDRAPSLGAINTPCIRLRIRRGCNTWLWAGHRCVGTFRFRSANADYGNRGFVLCRADNPMGLSLGI